MPHNGQTEKRHRAARATVRHDARATALYAATVSRHYERLVVDMEPREAMQRAISKAKEVVFIWEEVGDE